jgi:Trk K+ transport system NAD-binding subunit
VPAGERFVICGLSRLTVRVARSLAARDADVVVVAGDEGGDLALLLDEPIRVLRARGDREEAPRTAEAARP